MGDTGDSQHGGGHLGGFGGNYGQGHGVNVGHGGQGFGRFRVMRTHPSGSSTVQY